MKYFVIVLFSALFFAACSSTKLMELSNTSQEPCKSQTSIENASDFADETGGNLIFDHQGEAVFATMDITTYCNAALDVKLKQDGNNINLIVQNTSNNKDTCSCVKRLRTKLYNIAPGTYDVKVTNSKGQLITTGNFTYKPNE